MKRRVSGASRALAALLIVGANVTAGCGDDITETEYGELNREAFLTACNDLREDERLIRDVCECTYEKIETELTLGELAALEESLELDALRPLPDEIVGFVADCVLAEVDL